TITSIILIKLIRVSLGTVRHPRRFKIVVIDIQITLKQMLRDFIGIRVNRAKKSGMVNITSSVNSRERSGINTILHELNPFGPLLEDKLCLIFKLAPSVCRMTFPILASLLVRLVVLLPFQLLRLSLATPSRWTPLALSVFLHCVVALSHTVLDGIITTIMATIQRINIIGSREGSRNRRRLKANQTGKKFRVGIKSNISTNRNNLISGVDRCIHLNAMKKTTITSINRQTIKI